jgi:ABC-type Mn2+/Zn2+ transport system permease subunit
MFIFTPILAVFIVVLGLLLSFITDLPTGPTIATVSGILFLVTLLLKKVIRK